MGPDLASEATLRSGIVLPFNVLGLLKQPSAHGSLRPSSELLRPSSDLLRHGPSRSYPSFHSVTLLLGRTLRSARLQPKTSGRICVQKRTIRVLHMPIDVLFPKPEKESSNLPPIDG